MSSRGITLANLPGDGEDIILVLIDEFKSVKKLTSEQLAYLPQVKKALSHYGHQCSMFGVWGSRTQNGHLFSARNLGTNTLNNRKNIGVNVLTGMSL